MTTKRAKSKGAPMALRWYRALQESNELPSFNPGGVSVIAVAGVLLTFADSDGRNCRPGIDTILRRARVSKRTVRLVLGWLVENGWLAVTTKVERRPTVYRLTIPVGAEEHLPGEAPKVPRSTYEESPVGAVVGAVVGARRHPDLLPPDEVKGEEEESASARFADAPLACAPLDLFSDERATAEANGSVPPAAVDVDVVDIAQYIGQRSSTSIEPGRLGGALAGAKLRTGWSDAALAVYCVEKLKAQKRVGNPEAWLATVLGKVNADTVPSPRMDLADCLAKVRTLGYAFDEAGQGGSDPLTVLEDRLAEARLIGKDCGLPDPMDVKAADVEQVQLLAFGVVYEFRYERPSQPAPDP